MKSTFLFFNVPASGHVDPTLPVAAELVRRGHPVIYFLTQEYRRQVEATGATFREYPGFNPDYFEIVANRFNPVRLAAQLLETALELTPVLVEAIAQIQPQVVIYDTMCPWGRIAADQSGAPGVASMALMDLPPTYIFKSGEIRSIFEIMGRGLPWIPVYTRLARRLVRDTGVAIPSFARALNWPGARNLCYTAPEFYPQDHPLGPEYTFVGPPMTTGADPVPFPYDDLEADCPLVYVSLGTVFNNNPDFFRTCLAALADLEVQVVVSTGRRLREEDLAPVPKNAIVRDYVPQNEILKRARLFISHSGANSVHHALYHGVPLLMVPQQIEQAVIAARVAELGAGLVLNRRRVTRARVQGLAQQLLSDDSYRSRAAALGAALRRTGGAPQAADLLEQVASSRV